MPVNQTERGFSRLLEVVLPEVVYDANVSYCSCARLAWERRPFG